MASALSVPGKTETGHTGSVTLICDDTPEYPVAVQVSIDLAVLSVRLTPERAITLGTELMKWAIQGAQNEGAAGRVEIDPVG